MLKQVLIIQTASLGDVILSTALAESLHARYPEISIDYLVKKGYEGLFSGHPFIRKVLVIDKKHHKLRNLIKMAVNVRNTRYDAIVNIQRFFATGFITALSGAPVRSGFDKNPLSFTYTNKINHLIGDKSQGRHETERNQQLIDWLPDLQISKPALYPSKTDFDLVQQWGSERYITISPASLWFTKQFPVSGWIEFADKLPGDLLVILLGAPDDQDICDQISGKTRHPRMLSLAGQLSFLQSAAIMKGALMNYVNDSAPMHLASALNAPVAVVYCSTIPAFGFGPLSDDSNVIEALPPPECRPCGLHGYRHCPEGHFKCAKNIKTEQLLTRLRL
ncbi:MAG: glycosyltransferase family 9 protein [Lentimicrobium sp.]